MGYWSIFKSVDYMDDHCNYEMFMSPDDALAEIARTVPREGRVLVERSQALGITATTVNNTPAWAWIVPLGILWVRRTCHAEVAVLPGATGSVVQVRGKLDTDAANRIRALQPR